MGIFMWNQWDSRKGPEIGHGHWDTQLSIPCSSWGGETQAQARTNQYDGTGTWAGLITGIFSVAAVKLQDDLDPTKRARFQIADFTAGATRVWFEIEPEISGLGSAAASAPGWSTRFGGAATAFGRHLQ